MEIVVGILIIIILILVVYILLVQGQLRNINRQLDRRLNRNTRQPVSLDMINKELNALTVNINKCLKAEENFRLKDIRADKKFKELVANISHDLRTPLTAIKGYQQLMENDELTDTQKKRLEIIQKHTEELGSLIEHFFEYSYLINAEPTMNPERINLTNLVTECIVAAIPNLEEKNLTIDMKETAAIFAILDKEMVRRIVQNLIRNCIQHAKSMVEVSLTTQGKEAVLSFRNSVQETSEIDVTRLFDRFYTGDKARSRSTGLGLAIVKLLASQMNGSAGAVLEDGILSICVKLPIQI